MTCRAAQGFAWVRLDAGLLSLGQLAGPSSRHRADEAGQRARGGGWAAARCSNLSGDCACYLVSGRVVSRDEWRKHPMLTKQFRHSVPGLGIALVAFGVYLIGEAAYNKFKSPHSPHSSASSSHNH
ncbi:hypothetical protein Droror1_Dr00027241 [Drosera rotundifolia]